MFVILATKPLNDGTKVSVSTSLATRVSIVNDQLSISYGKSTGDVMTGYHFGKRSVYFQQATPKRNLSLCRVEDTMTGY